MLAITLKDRDMLDKIYFQLADRLRNVRRRIRDLFRNSDLCVVFLAKFYTLLCSSLRYTANREKIAEQDKAAKAKKQGLEADAVPLVICLWHDELFPLIHLQNDLDIVCIVSGSKDGAILEKLMQKLGLRTATGSSRRGGLKALLHSAKLMKNENVHACITVDGPMGPRHKAKDGAFLLAQKAGAKIQPIRLDIKTSYKLPSWDRFQIPLPFSRVDVRFGDGFFVTEELTEEYLTQCRGRLEKELTELLPEKP